MSTDVVTDRMTVDEFLALPEDPELDRELIDGVLVERPMTYRSRPHTRTQIRAGHEILKWLDSQKRPVGEAFAGEVGCRLPGRVTVCGIDLAIFSRDVLDSQPSDEERADPRVIEGAPLLAVEILSPSDTYESIWDKVEEYLAAGVPLVWVLNPHDQSVTVYRPEEASETFDAGDELTCPDVLPGFTVMVSKLFDR